MTAAPRKSMFRIPLWEPLMSLLDWLLHRERSPARTETDRGNSKEEVGRAALRATRESSTDCRADASGG